MGDTNVFHLFDYLPTHKLDEFDVDYGNPADPTQGYNLVYGLIGQRFEKSQLVAQKQSDGDVYWGMVQVVRSHPTSTASIIAGRPVFWSDRSKYIVTPDCASAAAARNFAGLPVSVPTTKGNVILIQTSGEVDGLFVNPLTKAAPALGDPVHLAVAAGIATLDVLLDATNYGTTNFGLFIGNVTEAVVAGAVSRILLKLDYGMSGTVALS